MLRAVAASRKAPWNDSRADSLDSATDARNVGVRLPCPFRYGVALAKAPAEAVAEPAEAKPQGFRSWTRRKPKLLERRDDDVTLRRSAERAENRLLLQEPPRKTNLTALQLVRALPSVGAPV